MPRLARPSGATLAVDPAAWWFRSAREDGIDQLVDVAEPA
jgi:hypothetical protein